MITKLKYLAMTLVSGCIILIVINSIYRTIIVEKGKQVTAGMNSAEVRKIMGKPQNITTTGVFPFMSIGRSYVYHPWIDVYLMLSPPFINLWDLRLFGSSDMDVVVTFGANDLVSTVAIPVKY